MSSKHLFRSLLNSTSFGTSLNSLLYHSCIFSFLIVNSLSSELTVIQSTFLTNANKNVTLYITVSWRLKRYELKADAEPYGITLNYNGLNSEQEYNTSQPIDTLG